MTSDRLIRQTRNLIGFVRAVFKASSRFLCQKPTETESESSIKLLKHNQEADPFNKKFSESVLFIVLFCDFRNFTCSRFQSSLSKIRARLRSQSDCEFAW